MTIYGCSDSSEDRLRSELDEANAKLMIFEQAQMMREQEEQARRDAQTSAALPGDMARGPVPAVHAMSDQDTLANLLPGGQTEFAPLSVALVRQFNGADRGTRAPDPGAAYVKSISSDGMGGLLLAYVLDGEESVAYFEADKFGSRDPCCWTVPESDRDIWLWAWNDSFNEDPNDPAATDRTDGSSDFTYFDMHGGGVYGALGYDWYFVYGARTMDGNLPSGTATYEGSLAAQIYYDDNPDANSDSSIWGSLNLEADFEGRTVSGSIADLTTYSSDGDLVLVSGNSIELSNGTIDAGGFTADWAGSGPMNAARHETMSGFEGAMVGEFYGPAAEEVGGVLRGHRAGDGSASGQNLFGMFGGNQPEPEVGQ